MNTLSVFDIHMGKNKFFPLEVKSVHHETNDSVRVTFNIPPDLMEVFAFKAGQYLTFRYSVDGESIRRSYSVCSSPNEQELSIGIRAIENGKFSTWAKRQLKVGDILTVMPPRGNFTCEIEPSNKKNYLCVAVGSGITPVMSILKTVLLTELDSTVTLVYGNRSLNTIMFREELGALKNKHLSRFQIVHMLSRERSAVDILNGRITGKEGAEIFKKVLVGRRFDDVFLCGPEAMVNDVSVMLKEFAITTGKVHRELYGDSSVSSDEVTRKQRERTSRYSDRVMVVTVKCDGRQTEMKLSPGGASILDTALQNGIDAPYACKSGSCGTCRAKLVDGRIEMDKQYALEKREEEEGFILTCQAHPVSEAVFVDFD
ncbi:MAG: 2Fe-2S iron-sulfur cluster-binding protein [Pseudomonadota bacterium]|nr:2Fe-2S iron-sulfur cluster-binding protein [Pseudomonadota bacterium]